MATTEELRARLDAGLAGGVSSPAEEAPTLDDLRARVSRATSIPEPREDAEVYYDMYGPEATPAVDQPVVPPIPDPLPFDTGLSRPRSYLRELPRGAGEILGAIPKALGVSRAGGNQQVLEAFDRLDAGEGSGFMGFSYPQEDWSNIELYRWGNPKVRRKLRKLYSKTDPRKTSLYEAGEAFQGKVADTFRTNPVYQGEFGQALSQGIGTTAGFAIAGALTRGAGLSSLAGAGLTGAAASSANQFDDALRSGASLEDAYRAANLGKVTGASEAVPISRFLDRIDKSTGGGIKRILIEGLKGGAEEGFQELFQQVGDNLIASGLVGYDPERGLFQGTEQGTGVGFTVGALFNTLAAMAGVKTRWKPSTPGAPVTGEGTAEFVPTMDVAGQPGMTLEGPGVVMARRAEPEARPATPAPSQDELRARLRAAPTGGSLQTRQADLAPEIGALAGAAVVPRGKPSTRRPIERLEQRAEIPAVGPSAPVLTARGREIEAEPVLVEAADLITSHYGPDVQLNPSYPAGLQPGARDRAGSRTQIAEIAGNLEPRLLGADTISAADGAPIIGPDNVVESGNARTMAIREAYRQASPAAQDYRDWLTSQGHDISNMRQPVLVRRRVTPMTEQDRRDFAREANERSTLTMSTPEQANADVAAFPEGLLDLYRGGDLNSAPNRQFIRSFIGQVVSEQDRGALTTEGGTLSQQGLNRVENALFANAYESPEILTSLREDTDTNIKAIGKAMIDAAPAWARMRGNVQSGAIPDHLDITRPLVQAANLVRQARSSGQKVGDMAAQRDMFVGEGPEDALSRAILEVFFRDDGLSKPRSRKKIAAALEYYTDQASKAEAGPALINMPPVSPTEILGRAVGRQGDLLTESPAAASDTALQEKADRIPSGTSQLYTFPGPLGALDRQWQRQADRIIDWLSTGNVSPFARYLGGYPFRDPTMGQLPSRPDYLTRRSLLQGDLVRADKMVAHLTDTFRKAKGEDQRRAIFDYLTTKGAKPRSLPENVRGAAVAAKSTIKKVGRNLVRRGLLSQESYDKHADAYLPRVYLKFLLERGDTGGGLKVSDQGYLKQRIEDLPQDYRDLFLGEVRDPGFLVSKAIQTPAADMAKQDFLRDLSQNPDWVWQGSLVKWTAPGMKKPRKVTPFWLKAEANALRDRARRVPDAAQQQRMRAVAEQMDATADTADFVKDTKLPENFRRMPDSPRYGDLRGLVVRKEIHDDIVGANRLFVGEQGIYDKTWDTLGRFNAFWKMMKVPFNPPTQMRNLVSNGVLLHLSGVPFAKLANLYRRAFREIRKNGKHYRIAKKYGIPASTLTSAELARLDADILRIKSQKGGMMGQLAGIAEPLARLSQKPGELYQFSETLGKMVKIIDAMEREGMSEADAVAAANETLFDYSLVPNLVKALRTRAIGAPFLTFYFKAFPAVARAAIKHPAKIAMYYALPYLLGDYLLQQLYDVDDDDVEKLRKAAPKWMQDQGHVYIYPYKDASGRWDFTNYGYFLPWAMHEKTLRQVGQIATGDPDTSITDLTSDLGILGGPVPQIMAAFQTGIDPFTERKIIEDTDPPKVQFWKLMNYAWRMGGPSWMTDQGVAGHLWRSINETPNYYGDPPLSVPQAVGRGFGVNIYPTDPVATRQRNLRRMVFEIEETRRAARRNLRNKRLSSEEKADLREQYKDKLDQLIMRKRTYEKESRVHPNLK